MGIYYNPPPPAGRTAVTPPEPHVPIGTQGNPPPRYSTALMLVAVLASWPVDLEPRLARPNEQRVKIAPLTLTYGAQPVPQAPIAAQRWAPIVAAWTQTWDAQSAPRSTAWSAPLVPFLAHTGSPAHVWTAWADPFIAPPRPVAIAPLTLVYGGQPQPQPPLSTIELAQIVSTWAQTWDSQTAPKSAWNVPPLVSFVAYTPPPALIWSAWGDPVQRPQTAPPNAGWNVPPILAPFLAFTPPPALIWTAWVEPFVRPPTPVTVAPLTLVYGDTPPLHATLSIRDLVQLVASWVQTWDAQTAGDSASWILPPTPVTSGSRIILVDGRLAIRLHNNVYAWLD